MAKSNAKSDAAAGEQSAGKGKKTLVLLISVILLLAGGGAGAAWYFTRSHGSKEAKPAPEKPPVFVTLEQFTVNLQPDEGDQFLQTGLTLKVADDATVDLIKLHMPEMRNRILLLLSSKKASQISTLEGKRQLSEELLAQVKQPFTEGGTPQPVLNVFFTSFVIQ